MSKKSAQVIANYFNVSINYILFGTTQKPLFEVNPKSENGDDPVELAIVEPSDSEEHKDEFESLLIELYRKLDTKSKLALLAEANKLIEEDK